MSDTKIFLKKLSLLALPIMVQNLFTSSLSFFDTLMIGTLGEIPIAAVGCANQIFMFINMIFFGIASGSAVFLSQYFGKNDAEKMKKTMSFAITIIGSVALIISLFSFIYPQGFLLVFSKDPEVLEVGITYIRTVSFSYICYAISLIVSTGFRSTRRAILPLGVTLTSVLTNILFNWLLIFGHGPFPELGVKGAAIATFIARALEMIILVCIAWTGKKTPFACSHKDFKWEPQFKKNYAIIALPVIMNESLWGLGNALYKVAFSLLGTSALACMNIVESINNFFLIAMLAIGNGAAVLIGNTLGKNDIQTALRWGRKVMYTTLVSGIILGLAEVLLAPFFASLFNVSEAIQLSSIKSMQVSGIFNPTRSLSAVLIIGILRAGGDTRFAFFTEMLALYTFGVPMAFICALVFKTDIHLIYAVVGIEEAIKFVVGALRVKSKKWLNVLE